ncbi:MAG: hypothetical protein AAF721_36635 [Myxococcota bacterium]
MVDVPGLPALLHLAVPFFVLGLGLWTWVVVRHVPPTRWRDVRHWIKAAVCTMGVVVGLGAMSVIFALVLRGLFPTL